ncbi:hypothetical protein BD626DRAFT_492009 [Schizophyllum amplum]|uniref:C2H2-type domain-containing protein n=1 Tax=Schizophyllum amplum TaxID=97359 RepID=A0A550CI55_9AGAR|nr:hypothetical protein BD626DRAFT_492009 [Auriculariopsis ampla]
MRASASAPSLNSHFPLFQTSPDSFPPSRASFPPQSSFPSQPSFPLQPSFSPYSPQASFLPGSSLTSISNSHNPHSEFYLPPLDLPFPFPASTSSMPAPSISPILDTTLLDAAPTSASSNSRSASPTSQQRSSGASATHSPRASATRSPESTTRRPSGSPASHLSVARPQVTTGAIARASSKRRCREVWSNSDIRCPHCGSTFTKRHNLRNHIRSHLDLREYVCEYCQAAFNNPGGLYRHRRSKGTCNVQRDEDGRAGSD